MVYNEHITHTAVLGQSPPPDATPSLFFQTLPQGIRSWEHQGRNMMRGEKGWNDRKSGPGASSHREPYSLSKQTLATQHVGPAAAPAEAVPGWGQVAPVTSWASYVPLHQNIPKVSPVFLCLSMSRELESTVLHPQPRHLDSRAISRAIAILTVELNQGPASHIF